MGSPGEVGFRKAIRQRYESLSRGQQALAEVFLVEDRDIAFLSGAQLAQKLGTSRSSLVRFAQALGYSGYPDLQRDIQDTVKERLRPSGALRGSLEAFAADEHSAQSPLKHAIHIDLEALGSLLEQITEDHFETAVKTIVSSQRIFVFGLGVSESLANFFAFRLRRYGWDVHILNRGGTALHDHLLLFGKTSCLVAFGFHRYPKELSVVLEHARRRQTQSVLVTDDPNSPYCRISDVALAGRRGRLGIMHSLAVPMVIAHALVLGVSISRRDKALQALETLEDLRDQLENTLPIGTRGESDRGT